MASISGTVTVAGDPDDWIACAFDADTHAFAGVAAVSDGTYSITGLTAGKAYVVVCRPKTGPVWKSSTIYSAGDYSIPIDPVSNSYIFKATAIEGSGGDEYFDNVVLLVPLSGDNGSTTFTDVKSHSISRSGNVVISTEQNKFYSSSAYFDGSGDYLLVADSLDFDLTGDFTAECWFYGSGFNAVKALFSLNGSGGLFLGTYSNGKLYVSSLQGGNILSTTTIPVNQWNHAAVVRSSGNLKLFLNGNAEGSPLSAAQSVTPATTVIGAYNTNADYAFSGYISDVRLTKGVARYSVNFTAPSSAFPVSRKLPSGSAEPAWPTLPGNTVVDGGVTWTNMGQLVQPLMQGPLIAT